MANQRGQTGYVALHGYLFPGTPLINGAVLAGAQAMDLDVAGGSSLYGVVAPGDTFSVAGVLGTYTVTTGTPVLAQGGQVLGVTFTPVAPVGGFPNNRAVTFVTPLVAQVRTWSYNPTLVVLDTTCMLQDWHTGRGGLATWVARVGLLLDYADPEQATMLDALLATNPAGRLAALTLGAKDTPTTGLGTWRPHVLCDAALIVQANVVSSYETLVALTIDLTRDQDALVPGTGGGGGGGSSTLLNDLIAFWKLEDADSTTREDAYTNNLDLTDNNGVTQEPAIINNGAGLAAASSQYLSRAAGGAGLLSFGDTDFTITLWVYLLDGLATYILCSKGTPLPTLTTMEYQIAFDLVSGRWQFLVGNGTTTGAVSHTSAAVPGVWTFLACRHDAAADTITITVNDPAVAPAVASWSGGSYLSGLDFALGRYGAYSGGHANAILDAVGVWGRVLTDQEITQLWNGTPLSVREYPFT